MADKLLTLLAYGLMAAFAIGIIGLLMPFIIFAIGFFGVYLFFGLVGKILNS